MAKIPRSDFEINIGYKTQTVEIRRPISKLSTYAHLGVAETRQPRADHVELQNCRVPQKSSQDARLVVQKSAGSKIGRQNVGHSNSLLRDCSPRQLFTIGVLRLIAANTSIHLRFPLHLNATDYIRNASRYFPVNIWWTFETHLELKFAYAQYANNQQYFCNALINTHLLSRYGTNADIVVMYPQEWKTHDKHTLSRFLQLIICPMQPPDSRQSKMLVQAQHKYPEFNMIPIPIVATTEGDNYNRILFFDSDSYVLNKMDHYFLAPLSRLAVPRAYWLNGQGQSLAEQTVCSHVMLLQPDQYSYTTIMDEVQRSSDFDMDIINHVFNASAMILPHRRLALLTGEFRAKSHEAYLSDEPDADWNAMGEVSRVCIGAFQRLVAT